MIEQGGAGVGCTLSVTGHLRLSLRTGYDCMHCRYTGMQMTQKSTVDSVYNFFIFTNKLLI